MRGKTEDREILPKKNIDWQTVKSALVDKKVD